jgi:hypothetical protein
VSATGPFSALTCEDCGDDFEWHSSPDLVRCQRCAEAREWREGGIDVDHIDQASRLSAGRVPTEA